MLNRIGDFQIKVIGKLKKKFNKDNFYINSSKIDLLYSDYEIYFKALKEGIKNKKVYNISLTGEYSSGKSSIIDSFIAREKKRMIGRINKNKFLKISLIDFKDDDRIEFNQKLLEEKILQQIIYSKTNYELPNSQFKRLEKENFKLKAVVHIFYLLLFINIFNKELYYKYLGEKNDVINILFNFFKSSESLFYPDLKVTLFLVMTTLFLAEIYTYIKRNRVYIKSVGKSSIELFSDKEDYDVFNKYLSEILYYFQCTETNIVFIEDLDRITCSKK